MHMPGEVLKHGEVELKVVGSDNCRHCVFNSDNSDTNGGYCVRPDKRGEDLFHCGIMQNGIKFVKLDEYVLLRLKGEL